MDSTTEALYATFSPNGLVNQGFSGMHPHITAGQSGSSLTVIINARLSG
jgi:hypothetical protein